MRLVSFSAILRYPFLFSILVVYSWNTHGCAFHDTSLTVLKTSSLTVSASTR